MKIGENEVKEIQIVTDDGELIASITDDDITSMFLCFFFYRIDQFITIIIFDTAKDNRDRIGRIATQALSHYIRSVI